MSAIIKLSVFIVGLIGSANAVKIEHFLQPGCAGSSGSCNNIASNTCCGTNMQAFKSATISPLYEDEIGAIYRRKKDSKKNCGVVVDSENGPITCLTTNLYQLRGAAWFDCVGCALNTSKRSKSIPDEFLPGAAGNCTNTVEPDMLTLADGHSFDIGPNTPRNVTQVLYEHAVAQNHIGDIPAELLAYKMDVDPNED